MKIVSLFNNKGGVGKSTLLYHLSNILAEMGHKTLIIDLNPQCNLTFCGMDEENLHQIWAEEDEFIDDFDSVAKKMTKENFNNFLKKPNIYTSTNCDTKKAIILPTIIHCD